MDLELKEIELAAKRLEPTIHRTKIESSKTFSDMTGGEIYLKFENQQKTGSFKIRGASNKIAALVERGEITSAVASSAGNHAQGVAYASHVHNIPATIVMPKSAPIAKVSATEGYGAKVVLYGDCYDDAYKKAVEIQEKEGATFLHPYDDLEVMAGQGTIGIEILEDLPTVDMVLVPAGGGGLLAGVAACIKQINPRVQIIGVQAEGAPAIYNSFKEKKHVTTDSAVTIADGIAVKIPGDKTVELINKYADDVVTVSDAEISEAILLLLERTKQVVEPAGATPLAAVLNNKVDVKGKKIACVLSGGNIDVTILSKVINRGLMKAGRSAELIIEMIDKPGQLKEVSALIADLGANVVSVHHDRGGEDTDINGCYLRIAMETRNWAHVEQIEKAISDAGYHIVHRQTDG